MKLDYGRVLPIFALVFVDILGLTIILPLLHLYAVAYGASALEIGLVAAAFPLAQLIGVPVMGALSDRYGRKPLLLISQITTCLSFIMLGMANSLWMVVLSRLIDGLFGANIATAQAALSDITTDENRAQGLGLTGAAFGLGFIFGPVIAILTLELSNNNLSLPAFTAAAYSFISILLTLFVFTETLPPDSRRAHQSRVVTPLMIVHLLRRSQINVLLILMFAQQFIFFGFESLLGLFTLSRLGILGQGNAIIFVIVGVLLVMVQVRFIGPWSRAYGEQRLVWGALGLLSAGLILIALTPEQPHPFYVQRLAMARLMEQSDTSSTEAIIGDIAVPLPDETNRGIMGVLWVVLAVVPLSIGAGLIKPALNTLLTRQVGRGEYGSILGVSSALVSAANAAAPFVGGLLFQQFGATLPFLAGGLLMGILCVVSLLVINPARQPVVSE